jgi:ubiquinone/menaquinone biosynthesis C-methylase UbiE
MYQVEDQHWWYQGMQSITRAWLERWVDFPNLKILDAGCGTGAAMTTYLNEYGTVTGIDLYPQALEFCRQRNASRLARASVLNLPFAPASFDLITSFDVLYERAVSSEGTALKEFFRVLSPTGRILLRLPAYDWLRGQHDKNVHTNRRYTKKLVRKLLEQSGFIVEHLSYANTFLFPLAVIKRLGEKIFPPKDNQSDLALNPGIFNRILKNILASEAPLAANFELPYGLSVIAVGRK